MTLANLILELRALANDTATCNSIRQETPGGKVDGVNYRYRLQNWPLVTTSFYLTIGTTFRTQTGFTLDETNGLIAMGTTGPGPTFTFTPTPPPAGTAPWECDYNFYWFSDTDHTVFLNNAARFLGDTGPTQTVDGLIPALLHFALQQFWMRRSAQYAHRYSSSGGTAGHSVDAVTKAFLDLAEAAEKKAKDLRDDYYKKQGKRENPSSGVGNYKVDPFTPMR